MNANYNKVPPKKNGVEPVIKTYDTLFDVIVNIPEVRQHENKESPEFISLVALHCNYAGIAISDTTREIQNMYNTLDESLVSAIVEQVYSEHSGENGSKAFMYNLKVRNNFDDEDSQKLPYIPDEVFDNLPPILQKGTSVFRSKRERDVFFLGQLVVTGSLLTTYGIYRNRKSYTNLYCFIVAPAASGKGSFLYAISASVRNATTYRRKVIPPL